MIALVEGAERQKTPNEIALNILLAGMTIIFVLAVATIPSFVAYAGGSVSVVVLIALFVTLIPTTIGALLVGDRHRRHGPAGALQRAGDVGPRRRSRRRRRYPAPGQNRHDHARQPSGNRARAAAGRLRTRAGECRPAREPQRRNAGGSFDRRAREGKVRPARPRHGADARPHRSILGANPDERHRGRRQLDPQGRGGRGAGACVPVRRRRHGAEPRAEGNRQPHRRLRWHAARRGAERSPARPDPPEGHRQGRHPRAFRRVAANGHPHRHDHRRQPR